eukprot:TRINITY_DN1342_c0_g1_i2.p1 TRINITY_DN1342_c0_g1~~TRINITY_DN1342_c0_g1_i2.p1  ORF type:complete len:305 (+),score=58.70 TRINITY_DN1342_c0_g1_i2:100-915(+)
MESHSLQFVFLGVLLVVSYGNELTTDTLNMDDACTDKEECGLQLMQRRGKETGEMTTAEEVAATWQGVRETGAHCMWSCGGDMGPVDCYHFRCVCKPNYIWDKKSKCVSRDSAAAEGLIAPEDSGSTCFKSGCREPATYCDDQKRCMCITGYKWAEGKCQLVTTTEAPMLRNVEDNSTTRDPDTDPDEEEGTWEWPDADGSAPEPPSSSASGGAGSGCEVPPACHKAVRWAIEHGFYEHPAWYPGLTGTSPEAEFQAQVHKTEPGLCPAPC